MISSNDCWLKQTCKKYNNQNKSCECRTADIFCVKLFKLDELYNRALMSTQQRTHKNLTLDSDKSDKVSYTQLKEFCDNVEDNILDGKNLFIYSHITGNGKTAWAERIAQTYINSIWHKASLDCKVLFISVPRLMIAMKDNISDTNEYFTYIKENVNDADLVIWDDIATKNATQFEHENLLSIIDHRLSVGKSNIFTANITPEEMADKLGPRLSSRIIGYSHCIQFVGADKRGIH